MPTLLTAFIHGIPLCTNEIYPRLSHEHYFPLRWMKMEEMAQTENSLLIYNFVQIAKVLSLVKECQN